MRHTSPEEPVAVSIRLIILVVSHNARLHGWLAAAADISQQRLGLPHLPADNITSRLCRMLGAY
jgi:hypothetical protein